MEKTPAGTTRWRVRVEGRKKRVPIPVGPDHSDFDDYYFAARAGRKLTKEPKPQPKKNTLSELCERFVAAMERRIGFRER
jgi:hypothetical protein